MSDMGQTHNRHPIPRPWEWCMGCLLRVIWDNYCAVHWECTVCMFQVKELLERTAQLQLQLDKTTRDKVGLMAELDGAKDTINSFDSDYNKVSMMQLCTLNMGTMNKYDTDMSNLTNCIQCISSPRWSFRVHIENPLIMWLLMNLASIQSGSLWGVMLLKYHHHDYLDDKYSES